MDENVRFRLQQLENDMLDVKDNAADREMLHDEIVALRADVSGILAIFKGAESTLLIAKVAGRTMIALAAFIAAMKATLWVIFHLPKP